MEVQNYLKKINRQEKGLLASKAFTDTDKNEIKTIYGQLRSICAKAIKVSNSVEL